MIGVDDGGSDGLTVLSNVGTVETPLGKREVGTDKTVLLPPEPTAVPPVAVALAVTVGVPPELGVALLWPPFEGDGELLLGGTIEGTLMLTGGMNAELEWAAEELPTLAGGGAFVGDGAALLGSGRTGGRLLMLSGGSGRIPELEGAAEALPPLADGDALVGDGRTGGRPLMLRGGSGSGRIPELEGAAEALPPLADGDALVGDGRTGGRPLMLRGGSGRIPGLEGAAEALLPLADGDTPVGDGEALLGCGKIGGRLTLIGGRGRMPPLLEDAELEGAAEEPPALAD